MTEPLMIALTILSFVWASYEIARRLELSNSGVFELWCAALTIAASGWIATVWAAALLGQLSRTVMIGRTILVAGVAVVLFLRRTPGGRPEARTTPWAFIPLLLWLVFLVWRAGIVPPLSHDALAYHLPRAVLWIREQAFVFFDLPVDARMRILPANYELLLADVILLGNADQWTELIAMFFYIAFVVACGALAERWWRSAAPGVALLCASVPVLLLHAGADKNDTMTAFFMVAALVWAGRWITTRDEASRTLCVIALAAAIGTKPQGLMLAAVLAPILLFAPKAQTRVSALRLALIAVIAFLFLGGVFYAAKLMNDSAVEALVRYDDWENLWQAPWVLLTAPFSPWPGDLYVPWEARPWFWRRNELYFSHLGVPFVTCAVLLPAGMWMFRHVVSDRLRERIAVSTAGLITLLLMLPVRDVPMPHGVYVAALPRYVLFIVPIVFGLTIAPALARLSLRHARIALLVFSAWFIHQAAYAATNDSFVPIEYVLWARSQPATRVVPFDPRRASTIADRLAGPDDPIAFDAGYAAWIHPAFGADLRRPVTFLAPGARVPESARWVIIDHSFPSIWQHKDFRDTSQWRVYLGGGVPRPDDVRLIQQLARDPRFELVYQRARLGEAVFRRR